MIRTSISLMQDVRPPRMASGSSSRYVPGSLLLEDLKRTFFAMFFFLEWTRFHRMDRRRCKLSARAFELQRGQKGPATRWAARWPIIPGFIRPRDKCRRSA